MREVVLVRVDDRLIHGQIIEAWVPYTKANTILIINEELSKDDFRRRIIESSVPQSLLVKIEDIKSGVDYLSGAKTETHAVQHLLPLDFRLDKWLKYERKHSRTKSDRIIVIFADLKSALTAYRMGFHFKELNLGNIHSFKGIESAADFNNDVKALTPSLFVNRLDIEVISELMEEGVSLDIRAVPSDRSLKPALNLFQG